MARQRTPDEIVEKALEQFRRNLNPDTADRFDLARKHGYSPEFAAIFAEQEERKTRNAARKARREAEEV